MHSDCTGAEQETVSQNPQE